MSLSEALTTAGIVAGIAIVIWLVGLIVRKRMTGQLGELVGQLVPVLMLGTIAVGVLLIIDPDQGDQLIDTTISAIPTVMIALILVIVARALGRIVGIFVETALRRVSPTMASRARMIVSSLILGIGLIIALQQLGISTDIILILVAAFAFGVSLAIALAVGFGAMPMARRVAAGRHVANRFEEGQLVHVGEIEGRLVDIGLASSRIEHMDGGFVEVPNDQFIKGAVRILG